MTNKISNYQSQGTAKTLAEANAEIAKARNATPANLRDSFSSKIKASHHGGFYIWYWILK